MMCGIEGCTKPVLARGWCKTHYQRWSRTGDPGTTAERNDHLRPVIINGEELYVCATCGVPKEPEAFALAKGCRSGRRGSCKRCISDREREQWAANAHRPSRDPIYKRDAQLRHKYQLTVGGYEAMKKAQGDVCAICGEASSWNRREGNVLVVDHDHLTGRVRGLLCHPCNQALGLFRDRPDLMLRAAEYVGVEVRQDEEIDAH